MIEDRIKAIFAQSLAHQKEHKCGGYPYESADMLAFLVKVAEAKKVLELGTGLGYTSSVIAGAGDEVGVETIDQDEGHLGMAQKNWQDLGLTLRVQGHLGKAEAVLPTLSGPYDLIFFDGHTPSMKFLLEFDRLLKKGGLLITANMFLRDQTGGKYMRSLQKPYKWQLATFSDTTLALKLKD